MPECRAYGRSLHELRCPRQLWNGLDKNAFERDPQRKDAVIRGQMATQGAVPLFWIAVESYMLIQKVLERLKGFPIPISRPQKGPKYFLEAAVLITRDTERSCSGINVANDT